jgi:hypothetical protein
MYKTRIASDYFTVQGLETRTGLSKASWENAVIKELVDNALDAIEAVPVKEITVEYSYGALGIYDNGSGLSIADVQSIYDFENYVSKNRHIINVSRGKQGNGLKSVIGICQQRGFRLIWHTNENKAICPLLDTENAQDGEISVTLNDGVAPTDRRGIEIRNFSFGTRQLIAYIREFSECNRDVRFIYCGPYEDEDCIFEPTTEPVNKQSETSLLFYDFKEFKRFLSVQDGARHYKDFLLEFFGTRIKNASQIKGRIADLDMDAVERDFNELRKEQKMKPLTILRKHMIGYKNIVEQYPYIIEYDVNQSDIPGTTAMINNSITYRDGESIDIPSGYYKTLGTKETYAGDLSGIIQSFKDYHVHIHVITPRPEFRDYGKTTLTLPRDTANALVSHMRKNINREKRTAASEEAKPPNKKDLAFRNLDEAYANASSNGKYNVNARQLFYKLRELIADDTWETQNTYSDFTQNWLTQWLDDHPEYESKVHFSDRGVFVVDGKSVGLGSANVQEFVRNESYRQNRFMLDANITLRLETDFDVSYRYDKALYIEKTGFNGIFMAEGIQEKYNMLIISGQGYGSRSARKLLHDLQKRGLAIYCMHDLDVDGIQILRSLGVANNKFKHNIAITDLGITPRDVSTYGIKPERVKSRNPDRLREMDPPHREFFDLDRDGYSRRVELNAFTTEQLLEIIHDKLKDKQSLPKLHISDALKVNEQKIKYYALFQLVEKKYGKMLSDVVIGDLPSDEMTYHEIIRHMPSIEKQLISEVSVKIEKELGKMEAAREHSPAFDRALESSERAYIDEMKALRPE